MKHVKLFEEFNAKSINEDFIFDKINKQPLFGQHEKMKATEFLKRIKKSPEAIEAINKNQNFGKGINAVKYLNKALPFNLEVIVYRSSWNYGGNIVVNIGVAGMGTLTTSDAPFHYTSGNSTTSPSYSFGHYFEGLVHPVNNKYTIKKGVYYNTMKSISNHDSILADIVTVFMDYEKKNGAPFDPKTANKIIKQRTEIKDEFNKVLNKIQKDYNELKSIADALRIEIAMPRLYINDKKIHMKVREPRQYRHPDEYNIDATASDKYHKFQSKLDKIMDTLDAFVSKHDLKLEISADWV